MSPARLLGAVLALAFPVLIIGLVLGLADPTTWLRVLLASIALVLGAAIMLLLLGALWRLVPDGDPSPRSDGGAWARDPNGFLARAVALYRESGRGETA